MLNSLSGNVIAAKARAIYGKRLTLSNYKELLRQRSVAEVAAYLKNNTAYQSEFSGINETQIHRGQLEILLHRARLNCYLRLCRYDFSGKNSFYRYAVADAEISVILSAIMMLNANKQELLLFSLPAYLKDHASFDFLSLSKIRSFSDMLDILSNTPYAKVLKRHDAKNGEIDLMRCEHDLKTYYYAHMLSQVKEQYRGKTRKQLTDLILSEIELANISLIYRLKVYFRKTPQEICNLILPFSYKLSKRRMNVLLEAPSGDAFLTLLSQNGYPSAQTASSFSYIEEYTKNLLFTQSRRLIRFPAGAPVAFYALMTHLRIELDNITTIIEGIRYQNNPEEIEKMLLLEQTQ